MTIETKFNLGDSVFILYRDKLHMVRIVKVNVQYGTEIDCVHTDDKKSISAQVPKQYTSYCVRFQSGGEDVFAEERLFTTKQDLLNSL